jgi:hypothetical protein
MVPKAALAYSAVPVVLLYDCTVRMHICINMHIGRHRHQRPAEILIGGEKSVKLFGKGDESQGSWETKGASDHSYRDGGELQYTMNMNAKN